MNDLLDKIREKKNRDWYIELLSISLSELPSMDLAIAAADAAYEKVSEAPQFPDETEIEHEDPDESWREEDEPPFPGGIPDASLAVRHAPEGGVTVGGTFFPGGRFIPDEAWEKATPEEKAKVEGGDGAAATPEKAPASDEKVVQSPEFKNFFGDWQKDPQGASKVVDESGRPLKVYHGTRGDFEEFKSGTKNAWSDAFGFDTYFFSQEKAVASSYASQFEDGKILETYLNIRNPLIIDAKGGEWTEAIGDAVDNLETYRTPEEKRFLEVRKELNDKYAYEFEYEPESVPPEEMKKLEDASRAFQDHITENKKLYREAPRQPFGYDGIIVKGVLDMTAVEPTEGTEGGYHPFTDVFIAFRPEQIKSAKNKGTFDPASKNINMGLAGSFAVGKDIENPRAQAILRKAMQAASKLSAAGYRELSAALRIKDPSQQATRIVAFVQRYRLQLAELLGGAQLASLLEGMKEVARRIPTTIPPPGVLPALPPSLTPDEAATLLTRLRNLQGQARAEAIYNLPPEQQAFATRGLALEAITPPPGAPPPFTPPAIPAGAPDRIVYPVIDEAVKELGTKRVVTRPEFDRLDDAARAKAFTVANVSAGETLEKIRDTLAEQIEKGVDREEWRDKVLDAVGEGTFLSERHLETVFRTNVQGAFSDGQKRVLDHPFVASGFPYSEYNAIHDDRVRDEHLALETLGIQGTNIYRNDDPVFITFRPPWDYNDRCNWNPISVKQAAAAGIKEAQEWLRTGVEPTDKAFVPFPSFRPPATFQRALAGSSLSIRISCEPLSNWVRPVPIEVPDNLPVKLTGPERVCRIKRRLRQVRTLNKDVRMSIAWLDEPGDILYFAIRHSPKPDGITIAGQFYPPGQFIPEAEFEKATPEEKAKIEGEGQEEEPEEEPEGYAGIYDVSEEEKVQAYTDYAQERVGEQLKPFRLNVPVKIREEWTGPEGLSDSLDSINFSKDFLDKVRMTDAKGIIKEYEDRRDRLLGKTYDDIGKLLKEMDDAPAEKKVQLHRQAQQKVAFVHELQAPSKYVWERITAGPFARIDAVIGHEIGRLIEDRYNVQFSTAIEKLGGTTPEETNKVSIHAATSPSALFAEITALKQVGRLHEVPKLLREAYQEALDAAGVPDLLPGEKKIKKPKREKRPLVKTPDKIAPVDDGVMQDVVQASLREAKLPDQHFDELGSIGFHEGTLPEVRATHAKGALVECYGYYQRGLRRIVLASNARSKNDDALNRLGNQNIAVFGGKVVLHEIGHHVHLAKLTDEACDEWEKISRKGLTARVSAYARENQGEHFAEVYREYTRGASYRAKLKVLEPAAYKFMAKIFRDGNMFLPPGQLASPEDQDKRYWGKLGKEE